MAFVKIGIHKQNLEPRKRLFKKRFPSESPYIEEFLKLLSVGEINKGQAVGEVRQLKYLDLLSIFFNKYKQPLSKLTKTDMQDFIDKLNKDKIRKQNKQPYSPATKQDLMISLRTYLKWRLPKKYVELTEWFDTRIKKTTPETLTEDEVEQLLNACANNMDRFLICVLFDSGMRAEEFLNVRFEDITNPTESFPYYKIEVKEEYSKTDGRTIGLYWKGSTKVMRDYLAECDKKPKEPVFKKDYDAVRMFLTRLGKRVLNKRVHFHLFRKSSATFYASRLNRQQLCIRYGWKFSSDMPDVYIKRAGIEEEEVKEKMLGTNLEKLEKEIKGLKESDKIFAEKLMDFLQLMQNNPKASKLMVKKDMAKIKELFA